MAAGFLGTPESGMLVCFPWFVLLVDTLSDCHLSYEPLVKATLLDILHYVQPHCPSSLYPSETPPLSCTFSHTPAFIEDDSSADESQVSISSNPESQPGPTVVPLVQPSSSPTSVAALSPADPSTNCLHCPLTFVYSWIGSALLLVTWSLLSSPLHIRMRW